MTLYHFLDRVANGETASAHERVSVHTVRGRYSRESDKGFTLIEIIVAVGLFTVVMTLASGAYLIMISANRQAQSVATGINNLSFALETMTRNIRTGTDYGCPTGGIDCPGGGDSFQFRNENGILVTYSRSSLLSAIQEVKGAAVRTLTDPSVNISSLMFYVSGTATRASGEYWQPRVTIIVSGTVSSGSGRPPESFTIETGATMRGSDI